MSITKKKRLLRSISALGLSIMLSLCSTSVFAGGGHAHGSAGHNSSETPENLIRQIHFSDDRETYITYPPLVSQHDNEFSVYVTQLESYAPLSSGIVNLYFKQDQKTKARFRVKQTVKPGLFLLNVSPRDHGTYELIVTVTAEDQTSEHHFGDVQIYADDKQASKVNLEKAGEIALPKQQQWDNAFSISEVQKRPLRPSISSFATVQAPPQSSTTIRAPSDGYYSASKPLNAGSHVTINQELGYLLPRFGEGSDYGDLIVAQEKARSQYQLAQADEKRLRDLLQQGAIPRQRYEEVQQALEVSAVELRTAQSRVQQRMQHTGQTGIALKAPITGKIIQSYVRPGSFIEEGDPLFSISGEALRWITLQIPEAFTDKVQSISGIEFFYNGTSTQLNIQNGIRVAELSQQIDSSTRTLNASIEYPSALGPKQIGKRFSAQVFVAPAKPLLSIPSSAVIDDNGRATVYIQRSGEYFSRKNVELGIEDGNWVEVLEGLQIGDRIVSNGAYLVKLASTGSDSIGHGHAH